MVSDKELIYRDDARAAVLRAEPRAAFCIDRVKAVDAVETGGDSALKKAMQLLAKEYEAAKGKNFVRCPIAYALYHTWKKVDEEYG